MRLKSEDRKSAYDSYILKYKETDEISNKFEVNYYFTTDSIFFRVIVFVNHFLMFKITHPEYLTYDLGQFLIDYNNSIKNGLLEEGEESDLDDDSDLIEDEEDEDNKFYYIQSPDDHPCVFEDIEGYYKTISKFYDCKKDYCFYNNCNSQHPLYIEPEKLNFMPNCYCIPLFCRDKYSNRSYSFHKEIVDTVGLDDETSDDYGYTMQFSDYQWEEQLYFHSVVDDYFDRGNNSFKCRVEFFQKNNETNKSFNVEMKMDDVTYDLKNKVLSIFFVNNRLMDDTIDKFKDLVDGFKIWTFVLYFLLLVVVGILLIIYMILQVNKLTQRMDKIKEIRSKIISISNDEKDKNSGKNEGNNDNKERILLDMEGEDSDSRLIGDDIIQKSSKTKKNNSSSPQNSKKNSKNSSLKLKSKEKQDLKLSEDYDELDNLLQLINENVNDFKIEFNLEENMNDNISVIKNQYNEILKVNEYKNKLLLKEKMLHKKKSELKESAKSLPINSEEDELIFSNKNYNITGQNIQNLENSKQKLTKSKEYVNNIHLMPKDSTQKIDDLSLKLFYEMLSLSTEETDFSKIKTNFYYKDDLDKSVLNIDDIIDKLNEGDSLESGEITNINKLGNAINFYYQNIHKYWKNQYDEQKKKDEI